MQLHLVIRSLVVKRSTPLGGFANTWDTPWLSPITAYINMSRQLDDLAAEPYRYITT